MNHSHVVSGSENNPCLCLSPHNEHNSLFQKDKIIILCGRTRLHNLPKLMLCPVNTVKRVCMPIPITLDGVVLCLISN